MEYTLTPPISFAGKKITKIAFTINDMIQLFDEHNNSFFVGMKNQKNLYSDEIKSLKRYAKNAGQ